VNTTLTLHERLAAARSRLIDAGISPAEAGLDVDLYARTILGWDRARLLTERAGMMPSSLEPRFSEWIERRERSEPSAYIIGMREFWGREFRVSPAVLIPRPETEFIIEEALPRLLTWTAKAPGEGGPVPPKPASEGGPRIADIGTGSGCLAVTLACEVPSSRVVASDVSAEALVVARENADRFGVADRVELVCSSYLDGVEGTFDLIVANPPYVKDRDKPALSRGVRHEPEVALFGGRDGLRDIERVIETAAQRLRRDGWFLMEFGYGQEDDVRALVAARPSLRLEHVRGDFQGIPRTMIIQRT
jgi:release factor glutamine methyltransferase